MRASTPTKHWTMMAILIVVGCGGKSLTGDDATGDGGDLTASSGEDGRTSSGTCAVPATSDAVYPYCRWEGGMGFESFCAPSYDGWGYLNWHTDADGSSYCSNDDSCNTCSCYVGCSYDPDKPIACPQPESGTAQAECLGAPTTTGTCMLTCDHGETCPTGMRCVDMNEFGRRVCAWTCNP